MKVKFDIMENISFLWICNYKVVLLISWVFGVLVGKEVFVDL